MEAEQSKAWVSNIKPASNYSNIANWHYRPKINSWHVVSIYFADEEDYVMYKMMVGGDTLHEYEVVLQQDL